MTVTATVGCAGSGITTGGEPGAWLDGAAAAVAGAVMVTAARRAGPAVNVGIGSMAGKARLAAAEPSGAGDGHGLAARGPDACGHVPVVTVR